MENNYTFVRFIRVPKQRSHPDAGMAILFLFFCQSLIIAF